MSRHLAHGLERRDTIVQRGLDVGDRRPCQPTARRAGDGASKRMTPSLLLEKFASHEEAPAGDDVRCTPPPEGPTPRRSNVHLWAIWTITSAADFYRRAFGLAIAWFRRRWNVRRMIEVLRYEERV